MTDSNDQRAGDVPASAISAGAPRPRCIYTALIGAYEDLTPQIIETPPDCARICFTDDPELRSDFWEMRLIEPLFARDPMRSQRELKIRCHAHLPDYAASIYIDNSVQLTQAALDLFTLLEKARDGIVMAPHSFRETVLDEFTEVSRVGLDDDSRIFEQLNHYLLSAPGCLDERPWWGGLMVRDHRNLRLRAALDHWAAQVMRYSRRDQLSVNYSFHKNGIEPSAINIDNLASPYHTWPHTAGRDPQRNREKLRDSLMPLAARLRVLEQEVETLRVAARDPESRQQNAQDAIKALQGTAREDDALRVIARDIDVMRSSTSWRITRPLRWLGDRIPASWRRLARPRTMLGMARTHLLPRIEARMQRLKYRLPVLDRHFIRQEHRRRFASVFGRPPAEPPRTFNERLLFKITNDRDPRLKIVNDKIAVRDFIRARVGEKFVVPLLGGWRSYDEVPWATIPLPVVVKPNNASGPYRFVHRREDLQSPDLKREIQTWLRTDYFDTSLEWGYRDITPRLVVEPLLIGEDGLPLAEYQVFTFGGRAAFVRVHVGIKASPSRRSAFYDFSGRRISLASPAIIDTDLPMSPDIRAECRYLAETLAEGFDHIRVDIFHTKDGLRVGELTPYCAAGLWRWTPGEADACIGEIWEEFNRAGPDADVENCAAMNRLRNLRFANDRGAQTS